MNRFVQKLASFGTLLAVEVAALEQVTSRPRKIAAKQDLIREGDRPGPVFVMLDGWAFRYKILPSGARAITAFLMPGDCCDLHVGMLAQMDHSIQTATPSRVATIQRGDMDRLMSDHQGITNAMYLAQLVDAGTLRAWIVSMSRRSSIERVAHLMCEVYVRARAIGLINGGDLTLPLAQGVLADALGITAVHMNRVLGELRAAGAMELQRASLTILDPLKLARVAGFDDNYLHRLPRDASETSGGSMPFLREQA